MDYTSSNLSFPSFVLGKYTLSIYSAVAEVLQSGFELLPIDREPLRAESFPDWSKLRSDPKAMDLQKRCHESKAVAMFRITQTEFLFVFEGGLQASPQLSIYQSHKQILPFTRINMAILYQAGIRTLLR